MTFDWKHRRFVADHPEFPGCCGIGSTKAEARTKLRKSIKERKNTEATR